MDIYTSSAEKASRAVTETFSHSFSSAIQLVDASIRQDIYNIYGLVRIADEIVDTYKGSDTEALLLDLENSIYSSLESGFSTNVIVHAFCETARKYTIDHDLIAPFFASMRSDISVTTYDEETYKTYIYGSAEVVGLMCLRVIVDGDDSLYNNLQTGAKALGAAYQKINFLRDVRDDYESRGRFYFPGTTYTEMSEGDKEAIVYDIKNDLTAAHKVIQHLPKNARFGIALSYEYYYNLLLVLENMSIEEIKQKRASVDKWRKLRILLQAKAGQYAR